MSGIRQAASYLTTVKLELTLDCLPPCLSLMLCFCQFAICELSILAQLLQMSHVLHVVHRYFTHFQIYSIHASFVQQKQVVTLSRYGVTCILMFVESQTSL